MNRTSGRSPFPTLIVLVAALLLTRMIVLVSATHLRVHVVSRRAHMDIDSEQTTPPSNRQVTRWLQNVPTVSTPTCNTIRTVPFAARLDLNYYYMVEMDDQQDVVSGIEDAIRHAIIEALDSCDIKDRPVYEISLESVHAVATDGFCLPQSSGNSCHIVYGSTSIFLDSGSIQAKTLVYEAINKILSNTALLQSFAPNVVSAHFLRIKSESLVNLNARIGGGGPNGSASSTSKVAIAVSSVAFFLVGIFTYGFLRRQNRNTIQQQRRGRRGPKTPQLHFSAANTGLRYFACLEDVESREDSGSAVVVSNIQDVLDEPSIIWSVSDMTSESGSVRSSKSRASSRLESIAEEPSAVEALEGQNEGCELPDYSAAYETHRSRLAELIKATQYESDYGVYSCHEDGQLPTLESTKHQIVSVIPSDAPLSPMDTSCESVTETSDGEDSDDENPGENRFVGGMSSDEESKEEAKFDISKKVAEEKRGAVTKVLTAPLRDVGNIQHCSSPSIMESIHKPSQETVEKTSAENFPTPTSLDPPGDLINDDSFETAHTTESEASLQRWLMTLLIRLQQSKEEK